MWPKRSFGLEYANGESSRQGLPPTIRRVLRTTGIKHRFDSVVALGVVRPSERRPTFGPTYSVAECGHQQPITAGMVLNVRRASA